MAEWGLFSSQYGHDVQAAVTATSNAAGNTWGAWSQVTASAPDGIVAVRIQGSGDNYSAGADMRQLHQLGIGTAGAEVVLIPNYSVAQQVALPYRDFIFPCRIPAGSRVAIRGQSARAAATASAQVITFIRGQSTVPFSLGSSVAAYAADLATSAGVSVLGKASGAAWVELVAVTDRPLRGILPMVQVSGAVEQTGYGTVEIGVGAAGAEQSIWTNVYQVNTSEYVRARNGDQWGMYAIPEGARVSARVTMATGADTTFYIHFLAITG